MIIVKLTGRCVSSHVFIIFATNGSGGWDILSFCCNKIDNVLAAIDMEGIVLELSVDYRDNIKQINK